MVNHDRRRGIVQYLQQISRKPDGSERTRIMSGYQGVDNIGDFFIQHCLKKCNRYRRTTGSFQSSALIDWAPSLYEMIGNNTKIEILTHLQLDPETIKNLETQTDEEKKEEEFFNEQNKELKKALRDAKDFSKNPEKHYKSRRKILAYLIKNKQLIIKFAYLRDQDYSDIERVRKQFHMKFGYFIFDENIKVAFEGGFNETDTGLRQSGESTQIQFSYRGGELSKQSLEDIITDTDSIWENGTDKVKVRDVSEETLAVCREISKGFKPSKKMLDKVDKKVSDTPESETTEEGPDLIFPDANKCWEHKKDAVKKFLEKKHGILSMATGTGKTSTALIIFSNLFERGEINSAIVAIDGDTLLRQWETEIKDWIKENCGENGIYKNIKNLVIYKNFDTSHDWSNFASFPKNSILLISTNSPVNLKATINSLDQPEKTIIIHDEVHGLASPGKMETLAGTGKSFIYRLGLSATPERSFDPTGEENQFIHDEVGETVFSYSLEDAIEEGILCEFNYYTIEYDLNDEEKEDRRKQMANMKTAEKERDFDRANDARINMAKILKLAESKPERLFKFIKKEGDQFLNSTIIFCLEKEQAKIFGSEVLHASGILDYHTYFDEDRSTLATYLNDLKTGKKQCLIACKMLSEGIDIKGLKNVILVSCNKGMLQTIQRVGRCLRSDPDDDKKRANVIDFKLEIDANSQEYSSDNDRVEYLTTVSKTKRGAKNRYAN